MVDPVGTSTSIDVNGVNINASTSINYTIGDTVTVIPQLIRHRVGYWQTDSVILMQQR